MTCRKACLIALSSSYSTLLPLFLTGNSLNHAPLEQDVSNMQLSQLTGMCDHHDAPSSKCILAANHQHFLQGNAAFSSLGE